MATAVAVAALLALTATQATAGGDAARDQGLILYWNDDPWPSIRVVRPDGAQARRILRTRQNAKRPRLSPNGRTVVFDGASPGKPVLSDFDIQVVGLDGRGRRTLTHGPEWDLDAAWSPDGRWIALSRHPPHPNGCGGATIWLIRPDGTGARRLVPGCSARWSPDGKAIVHSTPTARQLRVTQVRGGRSRVLVRMPRAEIGQPAAWSRNDEILVNRFFVGGISSTMYVFDIRRGAMRTLGGGHGADWSPDGSKIVYTTSSQSALSIMNRDGTAKRKLDVYGSEPSWD